MGGRRGCSLEAMSRKVQHSYSAHENSSGFEHAEVATRPEKWKARGKVGDNYSKFRRAPQLTSNATRNLEAPKNRSFLLEHEDKD